jgi:hypothetical protein
MYIKTNYICFTLDKRNDHYPETGNQRLINLRNHGLIFIRPACLFRNGLLFITININRNVIPDRGDMSKNLFNLKIKNNV